MQVRSKKNLFNEITAENSSQVEKETDEPFRTLNRQDQRTPP